MSFEMVDVGIVVYNTKFSILEKTIVSLLASNTSLSINLLCNNSDEHYFNQLNSLAKKHNVKLYRDPVNHGFGAGHNQLLKMISGKWYVCCNPDVEVSTNCISSLIDTAKRREDGVLFSPKIKSMDGSIQPIFRPHLTIKNWVLRQLCRVLPFLSQNFEVKFNPHLESELEFVSGCFFLVETKRMADLNGFDERFFLYCEDADLSLRASKIGRNYYVPQAEIYHLWGKAWTKSPRHVVYYFTSFFKYFFKHGFGSNVNLPSLKQSPE